MSTEHVAPQAGTLDVGGSAIPGLLYTATFTTIEPIGLVPAGLRLDVHYTGTMGSGALAGAPIEGIDYLLIRPDGTSELDVRARIATTRGAGIAIRARGYGQLAWTGPMPPLAMFVHPDFRWPDVASNLIGTAFCQTGDPALAWMNRSVLAFAGTANLGTKQLQVVARPITRELVMGAAP